MRSIKFWFILLVVCGFLAANKSSCVTNEQMKIVLADKYKYPTIIEFFDNNDFFVIDDANPDEIYIERGNITAVKVSYPSIFGHQNPLEVVILCADAMTNGLVPICSSGLYAK